jgi:hypothetical protein
MAEKVRTSLLYRIDGYKVGTIAFDLLLEESHGLVNTVTTHAVERGVEITDHIRNELQQGTLKGWVSNFSITRPEIASNRVQDVYDAFVKLWRDRTLVTIVTVLQVYEDVAITNVSIDRGSTDNESQSFSVSFKQIRKVQLRKIELSVRVNPKTMKTALEKQSAPKATTGTQVGQ